MKKLLFFILVALAVTSISSCSKDDNTKPSLEGYWYIHKESIVIDGETVHEELWEDCKAESHFQIKEDNSVTYRKFLICNGYTTENGVYYPDSDQIILEHEGKKYVYEVESVNGELLLSITATVTSNDKKIEETTIYHCKKGEPMPE